MMFYINYMTDLYIRDKIILKRMITFRHLLSSFEKQEKHSQMSLQITLILALVLN